LLARLPAVAGAKDAEVAMLRAELAAEPELRHRLELRLAELERRLGMDSTNSGMPTSKESIGTKERRKAGRDKRDSSDASGAGDCRPNGEQELPRCLPTAASVTSATGSAGLGGRKWSSD
jgi:hypothetical protein